MTTAKEAIYNLIDLFTPVGGITDREIANELGYPFASVRRTRLQLERAGRVWVDHSYPSGRVLHFSTRNPSEFSSNLRRQA